MLGYFSEDTTTDKATDITNYMTEALLVAPSNDKNTNKTLTQTDVIHILRHYTQSQEFSETLAQAETRKIQQYNDIEQQFTTLSASELYQTIIQADTEFEKQAAIDQLLSHGLRELEPDELKDIFMTIDDNMRRTEVLTVLMEKDEIEGVAIAKQFIEGASYIPDELYSRLYLSDPDYLTSYINQIDINTTSDNHGLYIFLDQEPELYKAFLSKNFDTLLASNNAQVLKKNAYPADLDISYSQQKTLTQLFGSKNHANREFALSMANNIDDPNLLYEAFGKLNSKTEQQQFLDILLKNEDNIEKLRLAETLKGLQDQY